MVYYDNIPEELKKLDQWVCANDGSKVPMKAWENEAASSTNPETWSDFETALESYNQHYYDYCGFVFADNGYVGIDIDEGYDEDGLMILSVSATAIRRNPGVGVDSISYSVELSPSKARTILLAWRFTRRLDTSL